MSSTITSTLSELNKFNPADTNEASRLAASEKKMKTQKMQFFSLLAQQLQNQDPTSPMDSNQMAAQMIGFSGLEQQLYTNQFLEKIEYTLQNQQRSQAANNIGKTAEYQGNHFKYSGEPIDLSYSFNAPVRGVSINIINGNNDIVFSEELSTAEGLSHFNWPGTDSKGRPMPPGTYKFEVIGESNEQLIPASHLTKGIVESVLSDEKGFRYVINGQEIDQHLVKKFSA